jgi:uncharacterized protein YjbI with pentapeptide repeats
MTKEEVAAVLADHARWLRDKSGKRANLTGANLEGAYLRGANLEGAHLTGAYLRGANLEGAYLTGAYLTGANLRGANLTGANLTGAYLTDAYLRGANLTGAYLTGAYLRGANLEGAYLTGANFRGAKINNDKTVIGILRRATRSDGWEFFLWHCEDGFYIKAGCRFFTLEEGRKHWKATRAGTALGDETQDILAMFAKAIKRRGAAQ